MEVINSSWKWWHSIIGVLILFISMGISIFALILVPDMSNWANILQFILFILLSLAFLWYLKTNNQYENPLGFNIISLKNLVIIILLGVIIIHLTDFAYRSLNPAAQFANIEFIKNLGLSVNFQKDLALILAITIGAPLGEELILRGIVFNSLLNGIKIDNIPYADKIPLIIGLIVSSLLFAVLHTGKGQSEIFFVFFIFGCVCALAYYFTKSFFAPVLIHSVNNSYNFIDGLIKSNIVLTNDFLYILVVIAPIICILILILIKRFLDLKNKELSTT